MSTTQIPTHTLGYPRIGERRELKKATEAYWQGKITRAELEETGRALRRQHWLAQQQAGIDLIPSNDFSFYDQMLDLSCLVGNVPPRFGWRGGEVDLDTRFAIARGVRPKAAHAENVPCGCAACQPAAATYASEMTKWFDTNYHYLVPEFLAETGFKLSSPKIFDEFSEALALGIRTKPCLIGPVTYLKLGKVQDPRAPSFDRFQLLPRLLPVYAEILRKLAALGAEWVQLDEPIFALDLTAGEKQCLADAYAALAQAAPGLKLLVAAYFGGLRDNLDAFLALPVRALHVDLVRAPEELDAVLRGLRPDLRLSLGIVDGRNIWRADFAAAKPLLQKAAAQLGADRLLIAPSCSLQHVPVTLRHEGKLDAELKGWLAYAEEKLAEVVTLRDTLTGAARPALLAANEAAARSRRASGRIHRAEVKARVGRVAPGDLNRRSPFARRQAEQRKRLALPPFPTTTIGSFPQTEAVRAARARWRKGELPDADYERFLEAETAACVRFQEEAGLDLLVHGEFERNDMVEYFGEQLEGFAFTENGWVQSYGSRYVKPPIIFGDVARPRPMTVRWSAYAQSLTPRPMKGMLTGPVTVLQWSFVRNDQPRSETAFQLALALREEVADLERAGIAAIQIDEPAIREGLPLRRADWDAYLRWAVDAFRLSAAVVRDDTQIHTHMCYAEFNDIIEAIAAMDADVITIETSRSNLELLEAFANFRYPNEIGPGVYDIHSPRVPAVAEMTGLLRRAAAVLPAANLWVNPDCGLKTRGWGEVKAALLNLVAAARELREGEGSRPAP
ncbi:MAG TPA: 5-methyltetrahydropteroyltriglutamate--homocysteine S-methyltransferase [Opitutaceae bacterium]|nr:5-methyltetrahydropteroyltriglutamate--homocysteine S-methyltransferase [Opitutaceae bacterium]